MDSFNNRLNSLASIWRNATGPQRWTSGLVLLAVAVGLMAATLRDHTARYVPLSLGAPLGPDQMQQVEQLFQERRLGDYRREGDQILVPEDRVEQYDSALSEAEQLPRDWASDWEAKFESANPFTSSHELEMMREIALAKELRRIILGLDGVAEASVVWADPARRRGWPSRRAQVTATVNVTPHPNTALPLKTIRAIQFAVANMVPNLLPQDVIVFDLVNGRHYQLAAAEAQFETEFDLWLERELDAWRNRVSLQLQRHWSAASVSVTADEPALRDVAWAEWRRSRSLDSNAPRAEEKFVPLTPAAPSPDRAESAFSHVRSGLIERVPEFLSVRVELTAEAAAEFIHEDGAADVNPVVPNEQELHSIHAQILAALPPAIRADALEIRVRTRPVAIDRAAVAPRAIVPDVAPATILLAVAVCLILFTLSWRTMTRDGHSMIAPPAVSESDPEPSADRAAELASTTPTPLGDPETVAAVLKAWTSRNPPSSP